MKIFRVLCSLFAGVLPILSGCAAEPHPSKKALTASVTYLHLLAKTPFFTRLSREQLQWVIDHSKEWQVAVELSG